MKKLIIMILLTYVSFLFSGCSISKTNNNMVKFTSSSSINEELNEAIVDMADQLVKNAKVNIMDKVALTTFVDLHRFDKTTYFGRKISESFFNELHVRGFRIIDLRGTKSIRVNNEGEFFITRSVNKLDNKRVESSFILVGTYSSFGNGVMMNARIIDTDSGDVVASARSIVEDIHCSEFDGCKPKPKKNYKKTTIPQKRMIQISTAK